MIRLSRLKRIPTPPTTACNAAVVGLLLLPLFAPSLSAQHPERWQVTATPTLQIGLVDGNPSYVFDAIVGARFLADGRIAVADAGYLDIRLFGRDGTFQTRVGGQGQGPGEFQYIGGLWITSAGLIAAWDPTNRRISLFTPAGTLRVTTSIRDNPVGGNLEVYLGTLSNDDVVLASLRLGTRAERTVPDPWTLALFGADGEYKSSLGTVRGMWRYNGYPIPFSPMPTIAVRNDSLIVADGFRPEITVQGPEGHTTRVIRTPDSDVGLSNSVWSSLATELEAQRKQLYVEYLNDERVPREGLMPQIGAILVDDRGLIWVKRYDPILDSIWLRRNPMWPGLGGEWWVLQPSGEQVATVQMPPGVRPLEIQTNRILGVLVDANDVERIVVLRLAR